MRVVDIETNEDGSAVIELQFTKEEERILKKDAKKVNLTLEEYLLQALAKAAGECKNAVQDLGKKV